ncbi:MAG: putative signaling protein, partial [Conexibacter sp.]|nr:putative signaling protein [Conexibacter sp.]
MAASSIAEIPRRVRAALLAGAALLGAVVALLAADQLVGLAGGSAPLHRWAVTACTLLATAATVTRVVTVERERRAWLPLAIGLSCYAAGWLLWTTIWSGDADAAIPSPSDALWLCFYPAAYATMAMLLRRSFVRAPASMWIDGLVAALTLAAAGIALVYAPVFDDASRSAIGVGVQTAYPLGDLAFVVLVLAIAAMSGWRPGARWLLIGGAMLCWFVGDVANLNHVAAGGGIATGAPDLFWCAGMGLLALAPWQRPSAPEGLRVEGVRVLLLPAGFSVVALGLLVLDRIAPLNGITVGLALAAVAVALARTTLTLREFQLLADARHESLTDELTGLPSRRHFHRRLDTVLREAEAENLPFALLIFDLDRFKELNDTLGHAAGDTLLQLVGRRLREALGRGALLARLGGDEFAVLLPSGNGREAALRAAELVVETIGRPFEIDGLALDVGVSVGVALYPEHASHDGELMRRADVAMYLAKGAGGGVALYDPERDLHTRDRLALGQQLREGLDRGELEVYYQPKVDPQLGRVLGVEALVRWQHPVHGLLMPPDFLPLAARSGLMARVTRQVLDAALGQLARWRADGLDLTVAVNLAVGDLLDPDLPGDVARMLAERDVPPTCLALEVTEDGLIADPEGAAATLDAIARLGVRVALDDYGTGWSSLAHLRRLPVAELKIDRSFVSGMVADEDDAAIVRTTLDLARSLRLRVVAEGVEDEDTWALLAELGADAIQGFVLSRPLPAAQIDAWLAARRDGP